MIRSKNFLSFIKPYRFTFLVGFLFLVLGAGVSMLFPYLMGKLLGKEEANSLVSDDLFGDLFNDKFNIVIALIVVFVVQAIFSFFRVYLFGVVTENTLNDLRKASFKHLVVSPMNFFNRNKVGELSSRIATDINLLQDTMNTTIAEFVRQIIIVFVSIIALFLFTPKLSLIMLAVVPVVIIGAIVFGRFIKKLSKQAQDVAAESNTILNEALSGIVNVKSFTNEWYEILRYNKSAENIKNLTLKAVVWRASFISFIIIAMFSTVVFIIWQGMLFVENGTLTQEEFYQFIFFTIFIGSSFGGLPNSYSNLKKAMGSTERLMEILGEEIELIQLEKKTSALRLTGKVEFKDVSFVYESRPEITVLDQVSFQALPGQKIALVGASGAGKTTISSLLLRFYEPTNGSIFYDDKSSGEYNLSAIRNEMTIVPQDVMLFNGTIKENILYGDVDASDEQIIDAAKKANAHDFIVSFPDGYNTVVGDRGIKLSGGQRQRIAIARAILKNPTILILDEATSSLDSESERLVQDALDKLMVNRTSFVIAHRLSTIKNCDNILVFEKGKLVEQGTHEELMLIPDGTYKHLAKIQFS